uniref:VTT domain-containing protein n=1 Tax=Cyclophora tenuis TaxID=216820 RepID=A0A7S1DCG4_CYCTE|mmetsp:Transcript_9385/g.15722  ORF Transcript_9385/g.15722 Transcript_9385/m.15722 type:complete len:353 (+) Transcript_9385:44-1102(+)
MSVENQSIENTSTSTSPPINELHQHEDSIEVTNETPSLDVKPVQSLDGTDEESTNQDQDWSEDQPEDDDDDRQQEQRSNLFQKSVIGLLLLAFIVYVIVDSITTGNVRSIIGSFLEWIEDNPIPGFFAFMIVYFVATILFVPGSILTLGSGFVFANAFGLGPGVLIGSLSVFFGASSGAIVSFLLGRYLLREWVKGLTKKYAIFEALDVALEEKGFRIMALLRLSPIIPFNAINYIGGVTALSLYAYTLALIAILPGTVLYVFLGASAGSLADSASSGNNATVTIIVVAVGCVFGFAAIFLTSYYAKKELNRVIDAREATNSSEDERGDVESGNAKAPKASSGNIEVPVASQ